MLALLVPSALAASEKWTLSYYTGDLGPFTTLAANPHGRSIGTFAFTLSPDQALLTSDANGYVKKGGLFGKTVTATIGIGAPAGTTFVGYDTGCSTPPTVRFYFDTKLALGPVKYDVNVASLWWSNPVSISLADLLAAGPNGSTLSVSFDPANWSDTDGDFGNADADHVGWFKQAASNVNKVGFSFGSGCSFAFGVGSDPGGALFNVFKFRTN